jgi:hypothetical protein
MTRVRRAFTLAWRWLVVGLPLGWGVARVVRQSIALFRW